MDLLRESALLKRKDLKEMMSSLAMALPHAAKFASSYFVAEVGSADQVFHAFLNFIGTCFGRCSFVYFDLGKYSRGVTSRQLYPPVCSTNPAPPVCKPEAVG